MADKFRLYAPCSVCHGTGKLSGVVSVTESAEIDCPHCKSELPPLGAKVFDGLRHVYAGRFQEVEDEPPPL